MRLVRYTSVGYTESPYSEEMNLRFFQDIIDCVDFDKWEILWKQKRKISSDFISINFLNKREKIIGKRVEKVDPGVAAESLIKHSDAVISMPFSSPSVIAKVEGVASVFYDSTNYIDIQERHGLFYLKNKNELIDWLGSLTN